MDQSCWAWVLVRAADFWWVRGDKMGGRLAAVHSQTSPALFHPRSLTECVRAQEHEVSNLTSIRAEGNGTHLATVKATIAEHSRHITDGGTGGPSPDVMSQLREAPRDTT